MPKKIQIKNTKFRALPKKKEEEGSNIHPCMP